MFVFVTFPSRVVHIKPFSPVERVNCQTVFLDVTGPFQLIMWKKMMHVLHTSELDSFIHQSEKGQEFVLVYLSLIIPADVI